MAKNKLVKRLRIVLIIIGVIIAGLFILRTVLHEKMPEGEVCEAADILAEKMLTAINKDAWDSTGVVQWTFKGFHSFVWDKERHFTQVKWGDYEVLVDINNIKGKAWKNGELITDEKKTNRLVKKAWKFWVNDSFWLNAPAKVFDPGTERKLVDYNGEQALMITYSSGGVTPGDTYLWLFDEKGLPRSWKLWVKIIPIGGVEFTWEQWSMLSTGANIATFHKGVLDLDISNLKAANTLDDMFETDIFEAIVKE